MERHRFNILPNHGSRWLPLQTHIILLITPKRAVIVHQWYLKQCSCAWLLIQRRDPQQQSFWNCHTSIITQSGDFPLKLSTIIRLQSHDKLTVQQACQVGGLWCVVSFNHYSSLKLISLPPDGPFSDVYICYVQEYSWCTQKCKLCDLTELNHQPFYPSVLLLSVKYCFLLAFFVHEEIMLCIKHTIRKFWKYMVFIYVFVMW